MITANDNFNISGTGGLKEEVNGNDTGDTIKRVKVTLIGEDDEVALIPEFSEGFRRMHLAKS